jgi:hypothetical protein
VSVAVALLAVGEIPITNLALIALAAVGVWLTVTLTRCQMALVVLGSNAVAIARLASVGAESIRSWCALITLTADHIWLTLAKATVLLTLLAERSSWVAVAR